MADYQPSFRKLDLIKQHQHEGSTNILGNSHHHPLNQQQHQPSQKLQSHLNTSYSDIPAHHMASQNAFTWQQNKYESNASNPSFILDPISKNGNSMGGDVFENVIQIKIRMPGKEDQLANLNLKVFTAQRGNTGSTSSAQHLRLELTDENNPLFLYLMELSESEFLHVKKEQDLHVDFFSFPQQFTDLIELCMKEEEDKGQFYCQLDVKSNVEADFNIVQMNRFKSLTHLSLRLRQANDEILKNFIAKKLQKANSENEQMRILCSRQEDDINSKSIELRIQGEEVKKLKEEQKRSIEEVRLEEQRKLHLTKEDNQNQTERIRAEYESNKLQSEQRFRKEIETTTDKLEKSTSKCLELSERIMQLESNIRELSTKGNTLEKESSANRKQLDDLRQQNRELNESRFQQEKKITELTFTNQALANQIDDKENLLLNNKDLVNNFSSVKEMLQQQCDEQRVQIQKNEQKLELCVEEINKGNKIIEKLQEELSKQKQKNKQKNQMVIKQEQHLEEIKNKNDSLKADLLKSAREYGTLELKVKEYETQIADYKGKFLESQKIIENNQSMIQYLNKQMNEGGASKFPMPSYPATQTAAGGFTPKPLYSSTISTYESKYSGNTAGMNAGAAGLSRKYSNLDFHTTGAGEAANPINTNYSSTNLKPAYTPRSASVTPSGIANSTLLNQSNTNSLHSVEPASTYKQPQQHSLQQPQQQQQMQYAQFSTQSAHSNYSDVPPSSSSLGMNANQSTWSKPTAINTHDRTPPNESSLVDESDFSQKYLQTNTFNVTKYQPKHQVSSLTQQKDLDYEEPQRITPVKYRQPSNLN